MLSACMIFDTPFRIGEISSKSKLEIFDGLEINSVKKSSLIMIIKDDILNLIAGKLDERNVCDILLT